MGSCSNGILDSGFNGVSLHGSKWIRKFGDMGHKVGWYEDVTIAPGENASEIQICRRRSTRARGAAKLEATFWKVHGIKRSRYGRGDFTALSMFRSDAWELNRDQYCARANLTFVNQEGGLYLLFFLRRIDAYLHRPDGNMVRKGNSNRCINDEYVGRPQGETRRSTFWIL